MKAWDIVGWVSSGDTSDVRRGQRVPSPVVAVHRPVTCRRGCIWTTSASVTLVGRGAEGAGGDSGEGVGFRIGTGEGGGKEAYFVETGKVTNDILEVDGSCSSAITCIDDTGRQVLHVAAGSGLQAGPSSFIPLPHPPPPLLPLE
jgi:hypothetical protein